MTYVPGELTVSKEGLLLSTGLDVRIIARSGEPVQYMNRNATSDELFHDRPDAADVLKYQKVTSTWAEDGYIRQTQRLEMKKAGLVRYFLIRKGMWSSIGVFWKAPRRIVEAGNRLGNVDKL